MENQNVQNKQSASALTTRQYNPDSSPPPTSFSATHRPLDPSPESPPERSPEQYSPAKSSISSDLSSLSHGFSPARKEQEQEHGPGSPREYTSQNVYENPPSPVPVPMAKRNMREQRNEPVTVKKSEQGARAGFATEEGGGGGGGGRLSRAPVKRTEVEVAVVKRAALGFRIFAFLFCLISASVMASDKNKGWAVDSFYRYKEFRYCTAVNVIGFVYSGIQGLYVAYQLAAGNYGTAGNNFRYYLDFALDQMLTYLLISASSSAATRVEDWQSNWGKDKFPDMATASVGLSFVAFVAFAFSSLISGYSLYAAKST